MDTGNVAILLTPPGSAAIAVIRIAGPGVRAFLANYFSRPTAGGRCIHGDLHDEKGEPMDDPIVVMSASGAAADLNVHGGAWVVQSILNLLSRVDFPLQNPLDVPNAAVDSPAGLEREIEQFLPLARTKLALSSLLVQKSLWAAWLGWAREASDQEVAASLRDILADRSLEHLLHPPRVAIVGAANVGKSTLANGLFAQNRSITADIPGTTRDWVGEIANLDGLVVTLIDTPGVRATTDEIEQAAIGRARDVAATADCIVLVLDASRPIEPDQSDLIQAYPTAIRVINKIDRPRRIEWSGVDSAIGTVASAGQGLDLLRKAIRSRFGCEQIESRRPRVWTTRQRTIIGEIVGINAKEMRMRLPDLDQ